jgi:hypothetical protein
MESDSRSKVRGSNVSRASKFEVGDDLIPPTVARFNLMLSAHWNA